NNTNAPLMFKVNAILDGEIDHAPFDLPDGILGAGAAIHVVDADKFGAALNASGKTAGEFLMGSGVAPNGINPGMAFQNLSMALGTATLSDASVFPSGPFGTYLTIPLSTGPVIVGAGKTFIVIFDVATSGLTSGGGCPSCKQGTGW